MSQQRFTSLQPAADLPELLALLGAKRPENNRRGAARGGWYTIRNITEDEAEIYIYDEIGYFGISANDFISELRDLKASNIALHINSPGGDVFDGVAIYNAIVRHKAKVTVSVDGIAASSASFIAMAGDEVVMAPHAQMMIHEAAGLTIGPADDMRAMADILDKSSDNIASIYAERAGGTVEDWRQKMKAETWFSDAEAVEAGLADRVDGEDEEAVAARIAARRVPASSEEPAPIAVLQLLQEGTSSVVRKQPMPAFDFAGAIKEAVSA